MTFKASAGLTVIIITTCVTVLFAILIGGQYAIITDNGHARPIYTTIACVLIYLIAFAFRPLGYLVTKENIIIRRPLFNVHIKRADVDTIELIQKNNIRASFRSIGVPGIFGFSGTFYNVTLGRMTWYVTRRDRPVLIRTRNKKQIVLTPDDPKKFIEQLSS